MSLSGVGYVKGRSPTPRLNRSATFLIHDVLKGYVASQASGARMEKEKRVCYGSRKGSHHSVQPAILAVRQARSGGSSVVRSPGAGLPRH